MVMEHKFDYSKAIEELEAIAARVEDPKTVIEDIDKYIKRSEELISACREYLRGVREKVDAMSGNL
jgi:exodeoxyribonuclease VII small subunit